MTVKEFLQYVIENKYDLDTEIRVARDRTTRDIEVIFRDGMTNRPYKFIEIRAKKKE